jgi:hypothetical protein
MRIAVTRSALIRGAVLGVMVLALIAGCSSSKKKAVVTPTAGGSSTVATPSPKVTTTPLVQGTLPSTIPNDPTVRKNVVQTKCEAIPGGWSASGTVKNTASKKLTYNILVYFTTNQGTTLNFAQVSVPVAAGATENWKAEKQFPALATMLCVLPGITAT